MIIDRFLQNIQQLKTYGSYNIGNKIGIALSGGVDSMVMLDLLVRLRKQHFLNLDIHAITIDHGLRSESSTEALNIQRVIYQRNKYPITHKILKINEQINPNQVEKHARDLRYKLMFQYCKDENINELYMGHHLNDQIETFLLRLKSNSTLFGLMGMKLETPSNLYNSHQIDLIRPMLNIKKDEIYAYATQNDLIWFEDHTNKDTSLTQRNQLRNAIETGIIKENDIIQLHQSLVKAMEKIIYKPMKELDNDMVVNYNISALSDFNISLLSLNIDINIKDKSLLNVIDYIILDRWIFNKIWKVSPQIKYHYRFTTFDSKNSVIIPNLKSRSLIEDVLRVKKGIVNISGCLIKWNQEDSNIKLTVYREPPRRFQEKYESYNSIDEICFDNRVFLKSPNPYNVEIFNGEKTSIVSNSGVKREITNMMNLPLNVKANKLISKIKQFYLPVISAPNDSYFPTFQQKNNKLKCFPKRDILT